jgi:hypothetical protein
MMRIDGHDSDAFEELTSDSKVVVVFYTDT